MNDFDYENLQKKRLARNAKYKKNGSRSKKCTFPSDYLTPAQKRKLNGPVTTYKLGEPMDWATFRAMPDELQKEYLEKLRDRFNASDRAIGGMMGVSHATIGVRRRELGIETDGRHRQSAEQIEEFYKWIEGEDNALTIEPEAEPEPEVERPEPIATETTAMTRIMGGSFTVNGPARDALATLLNLFKDDTREGTFTITFNYKEETAT